MHNTFLYNTQRLNPTISAIKTLISYIIPIDILSHIETWVNSGLEGIIELKSIFGCKIQDCNNTYGIILNLGMRSRE